MALSNMRNEPRREITEQVIGLVAIIIAGVLGYGFVCLAPFPPDMPITIKVGFIVLFVCVMPAVGLGLYGLWYLIHEVGEGVCGILAAVRADPRPKQRYRE